MPLVTREQLPALLKQAESSPSQVYLFFGERYLCKEAAGKLEQRLLAPGGTAEVIDGEREDTTSLVNKLRSYSLLPGRRVYRVNDTRLFHSKKVARNIWEKAVTAYQADKRTAALRSLRAFLETGGIDPRSPDANLAELTTKEWNHCFGFKKPDQDISWTQPFITELQEKAEGGGKSTADHSDLLTAALDKGIPKDNLLLLLAEEVDKRKKLFKYFKEHHTVIDLSVDTGASTKARKGQKDVLLALMRETLQADDKTITPRAAEMLLERVGFHPVGVVNEVNKVILFTGDRQQIVEEDIDAIVGRTRQEAVFELTSALTEGKPEQVLLIAARLQDNGIHPLAVIATLRNFVRSLLLYRALQEQPRFEYSPAMPPNVFQAKCLPLLKQEESWKKELAGHPYALYMQFKTASAYSLKKLTQWMRLILQAELRLKGSPVDGRTVIQQLLTDIIFNTPDIKQKM